MAIASPFQAAPVRRVGAALLVAALLLAGPSPAQAPKTSEKPAGPGGLVRNVEVSVTNLDVIVTDAKGNRVTGLKKEDFDVIEDGLQQPVTNFYAVEGGRVTFYGDEPVPTPAPATAPAAAPAPPPIAVPKTWIQIFIDNLHLSPANRNRVIKNVQDFVRTAARTDVEFGVVTFNRSLKTRRKFTTEVREVVDVLGQIETESTFGQTTISERRDLIQAIDDAQSEDQALARVRQYAESQANDLQFTFDALKTTVNQMAGLDGRKIMIHVSEGLPESPGREMWDYVQKRFNSIGGLTSDFEFNKQTSYVSIVQSANAAGVSIYPLDAGGLTVDSSFSAENRTTTARIDSFIERTNLQSMLQLMAEETGGKAILNQNDPTVALKEIEQDYTSYYSIGYHSLRSGADRPHRVEVKVKRKGLAARARRSYVEKSPETKVNEALLTALYFPRDDNPLQVGLEIADDHSTPVDRDTFNVPCKVRIPYARVTLLPEGPKLRGRVFVYFVVVDALENESDVVTQPIAIELDAKDVDQAARRDFVYTVTLRSRAGAHRLSLAVRDEVTNATSYVQKRFFVSAFAGRKK